MASGDTLLSFHPFANEPPATNPATPDLRNAHPCLEFDAATAEDAIFTGILPRNYAGGGVTIEIHWAADTAITGDVVWETAFERIGEGSQDIDADGFATGNTVTATAPGTSGFVDKAPRAHTDGAQMDSVAVGEAFRLRVRRLAADAGDTMAGDAQLVGVEIRET